MAKSMRAMVLERPLPAEAGPLASAGLPLPEPGPGEVRLRVLACGVCRTDLHVVEGDLPAHRLPVVPGHQVVGVVDAVGPAGGDRGAPDPSAAGPSAAGQTHAAAPAVASTPAPGTRMGVAWLHLACGSCAACRSGRENLCPAARFTGYDVDGGYAEAVVVPWAFAYPLPETLEPVRTAPLLCAGIIGYRSLRLAEVRPGSSVGLFGFGASAHLALQVARHWGCRVYAFTRGAAHRELALRLGATWAGGAEDRPPEPLDAAVSFAPSGSVVPAALGHLRPGGTLALNAVFLDRLPQMPYEILYGERTLRSVSNATRRDGEEFLRLAAEIPLRAAVETHPLEDANLALQRLKHGRVDGAAVLLPRTGLGPGVRAAALRPHE